MDILLGMCEPITVSFEFQGKRVDMKLRPLPARVAIPLNFSGSEIIYFPRSEIARKIFESSIVELEIDGRKRDWRKLPLPLQSAIFHLIITLNGLTPEGYKIVSEELRKLKENSLAGFEKREPPHEFSVWMLLAKAAFAALRAGLPFSQPILLDEPYLLILAVFTIAEAESEYYESLSQQVRGESSVHLPPPKIPSFTPQFRAQGEQGVREYMLEVFKQITGVSIVPPKSEEKK